MMRKTSVILLSAATGIKDQELSVAPKRSGVNNPAVTRGCDLRAGPGCQGNAFFRATDAVGTAKFAYLDAIHRHREQALGGRKGDGRAEPAGVFQRLQIGFAVKRYRGAFQAGNFGGFGGALQILLDLGDQALQTVGLAR